MSTRVNSGIGRAGQGAQIPRARSRDRGHGGTAAQAAALAQFLIHGEDTRHGVQESLPGVLGPSGKGKNYSTLGAHRENWRFDMGRTASLTMGTRKQHHEGKDRYIGWVQSENSVLSGVTIEGKPQSGIVLCH